MGRQAAARAGKAPSALRAPLASAARRGPPRARAWCSRLGLLAGPSGSCWPCTLLGGPHFPSGPGRGGAAPTGHWWSEAPAAAWQGFHAAPHGRLAQERGPEASPAGAAALQRPASQPHSALRAASASGRARAGPFAAPASSPQCLLQAGGAHAALGTASLGEHATCSWHRVLAGQDGRGSGGAALEVPLRASCGMHSRGGDPGLRVARVLGGHFSTAARARGVPCAGGLSPSWRRAGGCCAGPHPGESVPPGAPCLPSHGVSPPCRRQNWATA